MGSAWNDQSLHPGRPATLRYLSILTCVILNARGRSQVVMLITSVTSRLGRMSSLTVPGTLDGKVLADGSGGGAEGPVPSLVYSRE